MKESIFIGKDLLLKDALKKLNITAEGILLVVDGDSRLLGTLTDGDIRRGMLAGRGLDDSIEGVFNPKPGFLYEDSYDPERARDLFLVKRFNLIPILSRDMVVVRYITWADFFSEAQPAPGPRRKIDVPLVVMAGGKGTRMAPFTPVLPKPLIPIGDKTILEHIIDEFSLNGVSRYYFTLNYRGEMIRAYFDGIEKSYDIKYIWEKTFLGTAGSLKLLGRDAPEIFFVSNCDILVKADFADVLAFHTASGSWLTIISAVQHNTLAYGVVHFTKGGKVERIQEKPEYSFTINTGVYLLDRRCLDYIPAGRVFHMTDLIQALMDDGKPVFTYPVNEGEYTDIGQWEEYRNTVDRLNGGKTL